jgi:aminobenzoyl-glutamate transport protein
MSKKPSLFLRSLDHVERIGNALPHPATIFAILAVLVVILSAIAAATGLEATHPGTGEAIGPAAC